MPCIACVRAGRLINHHQACVHYVWLQPAVAPARPRPRCLCMWCRVCGDLISRRSVRCVVYRWVSGYAFCAHRFSLGYPRPDRGSSPAPPSPLCLSVGGRGACATYCATPAPTLIGPLASPPFAFSIHHLSLTPTRVLHFATTCFARLGVCYCFSQRREPRPSSRT